MNYLAKTKHPKDGLTEKVKELGEEYDLNSVIILMPRMDRRDLHIFNQDEVLKLKHNYNYYELITRFKPCKFYLDFDNKDLDFELLSYNEIDKCITSLIKYIKLVYNVDGYISYTLHISLQKENTNDISFGDVNDKFIQSCHIILDCYTDNNLIVKKCINSFFKSYSISHLNMFNQFDASVYSSNKKFRCINQTKEGKYSFLKKVKAINGKVIIDNTISGGDFITHIDASKNIYIKDNEPLEEESIFSSFDGEDIIGPNIIYAFDQDNLIRGYVSRIAQDKKQEKKLVNTQSWMKILYTVIQAYFLKNNSFDGIHDDEVVIDFLNRSRVEEYDDDISYQNNISLINQIIKNKNMVLSFSSKFMRPLTNKEAIKIYDKLNLDYNTELRLTRRLVDKDKLFVEIQNIRTLEVIALYDLNKYHLIPNFKVFDYRDENNKKRQVIKKKTGTREYMFLQDDEILNDRTKVEGVTEVDDLSKVNMDIHKSVYVNAPTGSGKTRSVLLPNVIDILKHKKNKIMIITETRSLSDKLYSDLIKCINPDNILLYKDKARASEFIDAPENFQIKILIVCYRSLVKFAEYKPTHLLIDEWKNLTNNFTGIIGDASNTKTDESKSLYDHFANLLKTTVVKIYDANINKWDMSYLNKLVRGMEYYKLVGFKQRNARVILQAEDLTFRELVKMGKEGKRCLIASSCRNKLIDLEHMLSKKEAFSTLYIDKDGATCSYTEKQSLTEKQDLKKQFVDDPNNEKWLKYSFVLYTATITCGLSIDNPVFNRTYLFLSMGGSNILQSAQMIERARNNKDNTLVITAYGDKLHTLKNTHIKVSNKINKENLKILTNNIKNNCFNHYLTRNTTELYSELNRYLKKEKYYKYWESVATYLQNQANSIKIFETMKVLYNWGHTQFEVNLYDEYKDEEITTLLDYEEENEKLKDLFKVKSVADKMYRDFMNTPFTDGIYDKRDEPTYETAKRYNLYQYGYTTVLYNKMNDQSERKEADAYVLTLGFDDATRTQFNNLKYIKYYEVKEVIYDMFENLSAFVNFEDIKNYPSNFHKNLKKLTSVYVAFKLFDENEINKDIIHLLTYRGIPLTEQKSFDAFKTKYEAIHKYFYPNESKDDLKNYFANVGFNYTRRELTISPQISSRLQLNRFIREADYDYIEEEEVDEVSDDEGTSEQKAERNRLLNCNNIFNGELSEFDANTLDTSGEIKLDELDDNTIDDVYNYFECNETVGLMGFYLKQTPKIRKIKNDFMSDKFITELLTPFNYTISPACVSIASERIEQSYVRINQELYQKKLQGFVWHKVAQNEITTQQGDAIDESELISQMKNKVKSAKEADKKESKKKRDKDRTKIKYECGVCGGTYDSSNKGKHEETKKHKKALVQNNQNETNQ